MSELKTIYAEDTFDEDYMDYHHSDKRYYREVYLKSEADKVIAEKDKEIGVQKRLRDMALASVPNVLKVMKIIQHHKYKRCLAMAKYCEAMCGHYLSYEEPKWFWYRKWHKCWLELAEKFKPNNSTAQ